MMAYVFALKEAKTASTRFHCVSVSTDVSSLFPLQMWIFFFLFLPD